jgi:Acyl carrier protein
MVFERICEALAEQFERDVTEITASTDIALDLGADSLDLVELITELEVVYNVTVTDESIYSCKTVGDLTEYVESLLK